MDYSIPKNETAGQTNLPVRKRGRWLKRILVALLLLFVIIQFFQSDKNNNSTSMANDISTLVPVPDTVNKLLRTACYDCHSNNTAYPWYSNIQPVGWWLSSHIEDGKRNLNFNEFSTYNKKRRQKKLEEIIDEVKEGGMPLSSYTLIHKNAKLDEGQKSLILDWAANASKIIDTLPDRN